MSMKKDHRIMYLQLSMWAETVPGTNAEWRDGGMEGWRDGQAGHDAYRSRH